MPRSLAKNPSRALSGDSMRPPCQRAPNCTLPPVDARHQAHLGHVAVDLGCGRRPVPGAFGLDSVALPGVRIVADLSAPHLPFRDATLDRVYALNVLEHLADLPAAVSEIARVLGPGGRCSIEVPYFAGVSAV